MHRLQLWNIAYRLSIDDFPLRLFGGARTLWRVCTGRTPPGCGSERWLVGRDPPKKNMMKIFSTKIGSQILSQIYFHDVFFCLNLEVNCFSKVIWRFIFWRFAEKGVPVPPPKNFQSTQRALEKRQLSSDQDLGYVGFLGGFVEILYSI